MIKRLHIQNFRGIEKATVEFAPMTLLTGANNSGKSSVMYALLVLKNLVTNPNQPLDSFFNFQFMNLGGFKENVFLKQDDLRQVEISVDCEEKGSAATFGVLFGKSQSRIFITVERPVTLRLALDVTFPYALNASTGGESKLNGADVKVTWNGITPSVSLVETDVIAAVKADISELTSAFNLPVEDLKHVDLIPLRRGFIKPVFSPVPLQPQLITEDEVATFVVNDRDLEAEVDHYLDKVVNKSFFTRTLLGASSFQLTTRDRSTGIVCDLVNDGFGTNQLVYLLCKTLRRAQELVCIEEPEIHMHPSALARMADVFQTISKKKQRAFVISSHSEHFVLSILNQIATGAVASDDVRLYFLKKEEARTVVELQSVNSSGQVGGGLLSFYDAELALMKQFLAVPEMK